LASAIPDTFLNATEKVMNVVNLQEIHNAFMASGTHLFRFVMNYTYQIEVNSNDKLVFFCQLASQYTNDLRFTDRYECIDNIEYPLIFPK